MPDSSALATDLVGSASAYPCKEELAVGHGIPCCKKGRSRALAKEIAATQGFDSHKFAQVIWFEQVSKLKVVD